MLETRATPLNRVHGTAIVHETAEIGADVVIGPYCVIGPNVTIGDRAELGPHVLIERDTRLGAGCRIHQGAVLGSDPQDLKYAGEPTELIVGGGTVVREYATLNRGTSAHGRTEIGGDCLIMAYAHVAHDCVLGDNVVIANAVNMGGHVSIEDWVVVGGGTQVHQFVRIGRHAFVGGASAVRKDVPPYVKVAGNPLQLYGLNSVGLERRGFAEDTRRELKRAYRLFFQSAMNVTQALEQARTLPSSPELDHFLDFIEGSQRGITV